MRQSERMNSVGNDWEPAPWDASDDIAYVQLEGYRERSAKPICWKAIRSVAPDDKLFGLEMQWFTSREIAYFAEHGGEQLLLIQLAWHGFPDPPEWGLSSRALASDAGQWSQWGYFSHLPACWAVPQGK